MANRLSTATSPYLLQHADNPVDWHEWGPAALAEAQDRDVPIFLSIGYAACHWCHVMARESFADESIAALVNQTSVPIKVDREERPDLDSIYMTATVAMTGQGGWPMSVWLTPDGKPFHAGTYFPPEPRHGMPSFPQVVTAVAEAWRDRPDEVRAGAADIATELARHTAVPPPGDIGADEIDAAIVSLAGDYDDTHAGFGGAPKFPPSMVLDALLARASQDSGPVADRAWTMARDTCLAMADGGIYDQLAGGFARYSTDRAWVVPHFEKMLYDNAILLATYTQAALEAERRGEEAARFSEVVHQTADWIITDLSTEQGGFASSLDADSDDEHGNHAEGAYYVWTPEQLAEVLGADLAARAAGSFRVTAQGTFEHGTSVLQRDPAHALDESTNEQVRLRLRQARGRRTPPDRDDKVVTAWNGWVIAALAEAAMVFDQPAWLAAAVKAAVFLLAQHFDNATGRLVRTSRDGVTSQAPGTADDYAALAHGCAVLAQAVSPGPASGRPTSGRPASGRPPADWLHYAVRLLDTLHTEFAAEDGGLYDTAADSEQLYLRPRDLAENSTPSATSAALRATRMVQRLHGGSEAADLWRRRADALLDSMGTLAARAPRAAGWALFDAITQHGARPAAEIAVIGSAAHLATSPPLVQASWRHAPAGSVIVGAIADVPSQEQIPVAVGRTMQDGKPAAYLCHEGICHAPVTATTDLIAGLTHP